MTGFVQHDGGKIVKRVPTSCLQGGAAGADQGLQRRTRHGPHPDKRADAPGGYHQANLPTFQHRNERNAARIFFPTLILFS